MQAPSQLYASVRQSIPNRCCHQELKRASPRHGSVLSIRAWVAVPMKSVAPLLDFCTHRKGAASSTRGLRLRVKPSKYSASRPLQVHHDHRHSRAREGAPSSRPIDWALGRQPVGRTRGQVFCTLMVPTTPIHCYCPHQPQREAFDEMLTGHRDCLVGNDGRSTGGATVLRLPQHANGRQCSDVEGSRRCR